jgi:hypothetical protein
MSEAHSNTDAPRANKQPTNKTIMNNTDAHTTKLWTAAILTYGIGDILTTLIALNAGLTEANPAFNILNTTTLGEAALIMLTAKTITIIFAWVSTRALTRLDAPYFNVFNYTIPAMAIIIGTAAVINNTHAVLPLFT